MSFLICLSTKYLEDIWLFKLLPHYACFIYKCMLVTAACLHDGNFACEAILFYNVLLAWPIITVITVIIIIIKLIPTLQFVKFLHLKIKFYTFKTMATVSKIRFVEIAKILLASNYGINYFKTMAIVSKIRNFLR